VTDDLRRRVMKAILLAGLTAGTFDILDPIIFWGIRAGVAPVRILYAVASGWLGRAAFNGGVPVAILGLVSHFSIATIWATIFVLASVQLPALRRRPLLWGPIYGLFVYTMMYYVVCPLSLALTRPSWDPVILANNLAIHMFGIGTPIAFITSRILGAEPVARPAHAATQAAGG
jgi:hypothetical protein